MTSETKNGVRIVSVPVGGVELSGEYIRARAPRGLVVLACANRGNARRSAEQSLTEQLHRSHISTFRIDLMSEEEAATDLMTEHIRRDVDLLARRLRFVHQWAKKQRNSQGVPLGYYGSGAPACAALRLASKQQPGVDAFVICEVKSDFDTIPGRDSQPPLAALHAGTEPDTELLCDLFKNWLWWEHNTPARGARPRPMQDRPSAPP
jgi:hypothetical protein